MRLYTYTTLYSTRALIYIRQNGSTSLFLSEFRAAAARKRERERGGERGKVRTRRGLAVLDPSGGSPSRGCRVVRLSSQFSLSLSLSLSLSNPPSLSLSFFPPLLPLFLLRYIPLLLLSAPFSRSPAGRLSLNFFYIIALPPSNLHFIFLLFIFFVEKKSFYLFCLALV